MPYNAMPAELLFLRQFLSQLGPNYPQVAMLVGLLLVAIFLHRGLDQLFSSARCD